jgi:acetyl-CoA C-acetyltransferase
MPYVASIGTYLPCWGTPHHRVPGDDEDAITLAVEAGRAALVSSGAVERVVFVSRDAVHDFFTGIELISYEDLGFAERFGGYKLVEAEVTTIGGGLPVNPSGGLKAKGHPPGATGVAQCVELFEQLRGEAANQVDGARIGLAHNIGGPTAVSAVTILEGSPNGAG